MRQPGNQGVLGRAERVQAAKLSGVCEKIEILVWPLVVALA